MDEVRIRKIRSSLLEASTATRLTILLGVVASLGAVAGLFSSYLPLKIGIGVIVGIALFILIYRNLQFGIILFFILNLTIPQAGPGLDLGIKAPVVGERGIHFNLHEIAMAMVLVAWLIQVFLKKASWREKSPMTISIIFYVLVSILSCFVGLLHGAIIWLVLFRFFRTALFAYMFFVVLNNVRTRRHFQQLVIALLICASLVAAFGLVQKVLGQKWSEKVAKEVFGDLLGYSEDVNIVAGAGPTQVYRINSTFLHPNTLGGYLVFALPFFISLLWHYRRWWMRLLLLMGLGMNLACLFYTGSRAAWIAAGCIILIYGALGIFDRRMVLAVATALMILVLIVVIFKPPEFLKQRFVSQSAKEATTGRLTQYRLALDFFMEHPIFGLGMGMEGQRIVENNIRKTWAAVENVYLTYLVSEGLLGLASFLLILIFYWAMLLWARNNSRDDDFICFNAEAFMLGMIGFAIPNLFGAWLLFAAPMISLFWFFLGMGGSLYNLFREEKEGW